MQFEELGTSLHLLRQSKGVQLEEVARHIKLSVRTLTSIEAGSVEGLPHAVYAKGFVRTYAKFLGMPEDELNAAILQAFPVDESEVNPPPVTLFKQHRKSNKLGAVILLFFLALLAIGAWYVYSNVIAKNQDQPAAPSTNTSAAPMLPIETHSSVVAGSYNGEAEPTQNSTQLLLERNFGPNATFDGDTLVAQTPNMPARENDVAASNSDVEGAVFFDSSAQEQTGQAAAKKYRVVVTATQECWLKATTDAGDERQFNLPKNQSSVFTFDKFLKLRLGNAAGVKIRYNGRDYPIPAEGGNTRSLVFPPSNQAAGQVSGQASGQAMGQAAQ